MLHRSKNACASLGLFGLQGQGPSHEVPNRPPSFYTRTDSLDVWLHQQRFKYSLHAIQREYEWQKKQVVG